VSGTERDAFRAEAEAFLAEHWPRRTAAEDPADRPLEHAALFEEKAADAEAAEVAAARAWRQLKWSAGYGYLHGPTRYGGRGLPRDWEQAFVDLEAEYDTPVETSLAVGLQMIGPAILEHGQEALKAKLLPAIYGGEVLCCQLYSEPGAGSDLASLRTSAVRDGDGWLVNGQKVWTSRAHLADVGQLLCRTDPSAPKHQGITAFMIDMHAPGVTVRRLRQMTGGATFNEVFLDDVHVPDDQRLGEVGAGWTVARSTLLHERASTAAGRHGHSSVAPALRVIATARERGRSHDPVLRQALAALYVEDRINGWLRDRAAAATEGPTAAQSIGKLRLARYLNDVGDVLGRIAGADLLADDGGARSGAGWWPLVLGAPAKRIAGGTHEIQKTMVAERVLGLPREPSPSGRGSGS
jgi:acyl-CoA dehydrogenase